MTFRIVEIPQGAGRLALLPLLLAADDAEDHVRAHLDDGYVFALVDDHASTVVGAVQAVPQDHVAGRVELALVAVAEVHRAKGVGKRLVALTLDELRRLGYLRAVVGTSNAGISQIAFYQKCGFRLLSIERDHFDAARGYDGTETENGIVHRDLVWFDQPLV